jgi:hypothetical protein
MQQPALKAVLQDSSGNALSSSTSSAVYATVQADPNDPTPCTETYRLANSSTNGQVSSYRTGAGATTYQPAALPFGKYDICAQYKSGSGFGTTRRWAMVTNVDLTTMTSPGATSTQTLKMTQSSSPSSALCPSL